MANLVGVPNSSVIGADINALQEQRKAQLEVELEKLKAEITENPYAAAFSLASNFAARYVRPVEQKRSIGVDELDQKYDQKKMELILANDKARNRFLYTLGSWEYEDGEYPMPMGQLESYNKNEEGVKRFVLDDQSNVKQTIDLKSIQLGSEE
ncbi:MAG TPA: hypothetical protein VHA74_00200 [Candidatus Dojkabacteria bacterium]|nr:hypothetical protein [Candidatus Dojkabacteria bacterium]